MVVGLATAGQRPEELVPTLRQSSGRAANELRATFPALRLEWTGEIALNYDLRRVSAADAEGAERKVLPLTLVLLIVAFGAVAVEKSLAIRAEKSVISAANAQAVASASIGWPAASWTLILPPVSSNRSPGARVPATGPLPILAVS